MYLLSFLRFWTLSIERFSFLFRSILNGVTLKTSNRGACARRRRRAGSQDQRKLWHKPQIRDSTRKTTNHPPESVQLTVPFLEVNTFLVLSRNRSALQTR